MLKLFLTCMSFFLQLNTKEDILKNAVNKQLVLAIDFHSMEKILWKSVATCNSLVTNIAQNNCLVPNILQNIFLCVQQKKEIHTGLEQHEDFWVNYPFKQGLMAVCR